MSATNTKPAATLNLLNSATASERSDSSSIYGHEQRKAAEERIFSDETGGGASIVYGQPAAQQKLHEVPIRRYLDEAKEQIDVIDFTQPKFRYVYVLGIVGSKIHFVPHEHCIYSTLINAKKNNANVIYVGQTWLLNTCRVFRLPSVAFSMPGRILKRIFSKG